MKRFVSLVLVLLLLLTAAGCRQEESLPSATTSPATPEFTARELYWKMRNAIGMGYPTCYTEEQEFFYSVDTREAGFRERTQAVIAKDPYRMNVGYEWTEYDDEEELTSYRILYYREKEEGVDVYGYDGTSGYWFYDDAEGLTRRELEIGRATLHPTEFSENMTLDPETQTVGEREAYVLRYRESFSESFGETSVPEKYAVLKTMEAENRLYIDVETFRLLQAEVELSELSEAEAKAVYWFYTGADYTGKKALTVTSFLCAYRGIRYDAVEVPPVPEEAFEQVHGFGNT